MFISQSLCWNIWGFISEFCVHLPYAVVLPHPSCSQRTRQYFCKNTLQRQIPVKYTTIYKGFTGVHASYNDPPESRMTVEQHCWQLVCSRVCFTENNYFKITHFSPLSDLCVPPANSCPRVLHMGTEWIDVPSHVFLSSTGPQIRHFYPSGENKSS